MVFGHRISLFFFPFSFFFLFFFFFEKQISLLKMNNGYRKWILITKLVVTLLNTSR